MQLIGHRVIHDNSIIPCFRVVAMVRMKGLEPSRLAALVPKTSVSTNSTTSAGSGLLTHRFYPVFLCLASLVLTPSGLCDAHECLNGLVAQPYFR